jgi:hypothetical protein
MEKISEYKGGLLSHLVAVHKPGERAMAVELAQALGLTTVEMPLGGNFSLVAFHPNADDRNTVDNVIFLFEMSPWQAVLEAAVQKGMASDPEIAAAVATYREGAQTTPDGTPHFGLHFASASALDQAVDKLRQLSPAIRERVSVKEMPAYGEVPGFPAIRQVFVYTDVFTTGLNAAGQLIELQIER